MACFCAARLPVERSAKEASTSPCASTGSGDEDEAPMAATASNGSIGSNGASANWREALSLKGAMTHVPALRPHYIGTSMRALREEADLLRSMLHETMLHGFRSASPDMDASTTMKGMDLDFSWMFVFDLPPHDVPPGKRRTRSRRAIIMAAITRLARALPRPGCCRRRPPVSPTQVLKDSFPFVDESSVDMLFWSDRAGGTPQNGDADAIRVCAPVAHNSLDEPLVQAPRSNPQDRTTHELEADSEEVHERQLQSAIDMTIGFLDSLSESLLDALGHVDTKRLKTQQRWLQERLATTLKHAASPAPELVSQKPEPMRILYFKDAKLLQDDSPYHERLYICVRMELQVAELLADSIEYPVQLSHEGIRQLNIRPGGGHLEDNLCWPVISCMYGDSPGTTTPAYVKYDSYFRGLCQKHPDELDPRARTVLRQIDRLRVLFDKVAESVKVEQLQAAGLMQSSFPLHERASLERLKTTWGSFRRLLSLLYSTEEMHHEVRGYFGEAIGFYFLFVGDLARAYIFFLIPVVLLCFASDRVIPGNQPFVKFMEVCFELAWFRFFTKWWQRRENHYVNKWGMDQQGVSKLASLPNVRFRGTYQPSKLNQNEVSLQVPKWWQLLGRIAAAILTGLFIVLVITGNILELMFFFDFYEQLPPHRWQQACLASMSALNGVQIKLVDSVWSVFSIYITDLEFRELADDFQWSKRIKTVLVRFAGTIVPLLYFAFALPMMDHTMCSKKDGTCVNYYRAMLSAMLNGIFFCRFVLAAIIDDVLVPFIKVRYRRTSLYQVIRHVALPHLCYKCGLRQAEVQPEHEPSFIELQAEMEPYRHSSLTQDYLDILLPLGVTLLFATVSSGIFLWFPTIVLLKARADAWKLSNLFQRPYPHMASGIGFFHSLLGIYGHLMIFTNLMLLVFYFDSFESLPWVSVVWSKLFATAKGQGDVLVTNVEALSFFPSALLMLLVWHSVESCIPGRSSHLQCDIQRQQLQRRALFYDSGLQQQESGEDFRPTLSILEGNEHAHEIQNFKNLDLPTDVVLANRHQIVW